MITSEKKVIEYFNLGFKLEIAKQFKRSFYYLTNHKNQELTVSKNIIVKMKEKGFINSDDDFTLNLKK